MVDIVAADNLPNTSGIPASTLKNFVQTRDAAAARGDARRKNVLLYLSSYEFDDGAYLELQRNGSALVFSFSDVLCEKGFRRAIVLSKMRLALAACRKAGCGFVVCTLAKNEAGLRNARELVAFMAVLGMTQEERKFSKELLERLAGGVAERGGHTKQSGFADEKKSNSLPERSMPPSQTPPKPVK